MKKFMAIGATLILIGSLVYMAFANPHVPLLDANRTVLAESYEQGYCSGLVFGQTRGQGSASAVAECRAESDLDDEINWNLVQPGFCEGFNKATQFPTSQCIDIVESQLYWPTLEGTVTQAWNRAFPYPGGTISDSMSSRGNDRDNNEREGLDR